MQGCETSCALNALCLSLHRTSQAFPEHPQLKQLQLLVSALSAKPPIGYETQTCMLISRADGSTYVHDFVPDEIKLKLAAGGASEVGGPPSSTPQGGGETTGDGDIAQPSVEAAEQPRAAEEDGGGDAPSPDESKKAEAAETTDAPPSDSLASLTAGGPPDTSPSVQVAAMATAPSAMETIRAAQLQDPKMVCNLPGDLLSAFGLLPTVSSLQAAPLLRFYR